MSGHTRSQHIVLFFALACAVTWALATPLVLAWLQQVEPPAYAIPLAGLSALGPTIAAIVLARRERRVRELFGRWRAHPLWIVLALLTPMALHMVANLLELALGGRPSQWVYLPVTAEHVAALVMFSLGEEIGWRGYAHPRVTAWLGMVRGSVVLGAVWGVWHLLYCVTPSGSFDATAFGLGLIELSLYSIVFAWIFERASRSLTVAIALHAGGHLDNLHRAPESDLRVRVLYLVVVAAAALLAARSLRRLRLPLPPGR
jgi:membrane protease YdiL (CAAX protease family)